LYYNKIYGLARVFKLVSTMIPGQQLLQVSKRGRTEEVKTALELLTEPSTDLIEHDEKGNARFRFPEV